MSKDDRLTILTNFEDHYTIILKIEADSISNSIHELENIIKILE